MPDVSHSSSLYLPLRHAFRIRLQIPSSKAFPHPFVPSPGPARTAALRPQFSLGASKCDFLAFQKSSYFLLPFFLEKNAKIMDFGLPKPFRNPSKMPSKSTSRKTCIFSSMFCLFWLFSALCAFSSKCLKPSKNCGFVAFRTFWQCMRRGRKSNDKRHVLAFRTEVLKHPAPSKAIPERAKRQRKRQQVRKNAARRQRSAQAFKIEPTWPQHGSNMGSGGSCPGSGWPPA